MIKLYRKYVTNGQQTIAFAVSLLLPIVLFAPSVYAAEGDFYAAEGDLCAPFEESEIDHSLVKKMLDAAEDGYLYRINTKTSKMGFCVQSPVGMVKGDFKNFNGGLVLDGVSNQTVVRAKVDSLKTNNIIIEKTLKSKSFFNVKEYPELLFVSSGFEWITSNKAVLKGELSMRGVTKPVAFYVEIIDVEDDYGADTIMVKATTTVQRSEFGMDKLSSMVNDRVNLCMSVEAERYVSG